MPPRRLRIPADHVIYAFDPSSPPIARVTPPVTLTVQARDAYDRGCNDLDIHAYLAQRLPGRMNPATGPIAIQGAQSGDTLHVHIQALRVGPRGYVATTPGTGLLGDHPVPPSVQPFDVDGQTVTVAGVPLPLRPMVGTIGVAPASGAIEALSLGIHGGNLDFNDITAGTIVHLPVWAPDALFAIGDVHATMGDGEAHSGVNIDAEIDLRLELTTGAPLDWPWFETPTHVMTVGVHDDLTQALRIAQDAMETRLIDQLDISIETARALAGAAMDLRLGQAGGYGVPVSAYATFPKSALTASQPECDETLMTAQEPVDDATEAEDAGLAQAIVQGLSTEPVSKQRVLDALETPIPKSP